MLKGLYNIDPSADFLDCLARGLLSYDAGASPLVLLPSRRACLGLRDAVLDRLVDDQAAEFGRIVPIGELDCLAAGLIPPAPLPDAIEPLARELIFTRLIKAERAASGGITDEHALRLARELGTLLDECQTEEIELAALTGLVPENFADHWQDILAFLSIVIEQWPQILRSLGKADFHDRRRIALDQVGGQWALNPATQPVIAAGMTGTIPAVARLLATIQDLPQGVIVLPGLDRMMSDAEWAAVRSAPSHPQYGLAMLLDGLGADRADVRPWPNQEISGQGHARAAFLSDVMRPASTSDLWRHSERPSDMALEGVSRVEFDDAQHEARAAALMIRETLEMPGKTVALVTSDRTLARAVANILNQTGIDATDSAGTPLDQTTPGSLIILAARALIDRWTPIALLSLLKHPLVCCGRERAECRRLVRTIELRLLHRTRIGNGLAGLVEVLQAEMAEDDAQAVASLDLLRDLIDAAGAIDALTGDGPLEFGNILQEHIRFCEWLVRDAEGGHGELWAKAAGAKAQDLMDQLQDAAVFLPEIGFEAFPVLLAVLMSAETVRDERPGHPRVLILGQLESRLLAVDRVLIAGLREGVWPKKPDPSPWLNRAMRASVGLPPADARIGFAAHDFFMAAMRPELILSHASKDWQGSPGTASRWLSRLGTVLRSHGMNRVLDPSEATPWADWARHLIRPDPPAAPTQRPEPKPPAAARPRDLAVTDIEILIRDPYAFYAKRILNLKPLDPIDVDPGGAERGIMIHEAVERFVTETAALWPVDPIGRLLAIGQELFGQYEHQPQIRAIWWPRFVSIAEAFVAEEQQRRALLERTFVELEGMIELRAQSGPLRLRGRADRMELDLEGKLNLIDYKTGSLPKAADVALGISPQLALTALIAREGGFDGIGKRETGSLAYWALKGGLDGNEIKPATKSENVTTLVEQARGGLGQLIDYFSEAKHGYPAVPRPEIAPGFSDYEHLARISEWRGQL